MTPVLAGALCAACTNDGDQPTPPPIAVEAQALWLDSTGWRNGAPHVEIRGESVLVFGDTRDEPNRALAVRDAATGEVRWQVDTRKTLPGEEGLLRAGTSAQTDMPVVGTDDWTVFLPYATAAEEFGVAALAGTNGEARWTSPPVRDRAAGKLHVLAANDNIVVSMFTGDRTPARTVATDAATGRRLWESPGVVPQFVVGDTVLGQTGVPFHSGPEASEPSPDSDLVALDAATGRKKWDLPGSKVFQTLGELAVVSAPGRKLVVDAGTGREVADLGAVAYCVSNQENLVVCQSDLRGMTFYDAAERTTSWVAMPDSSLRGTWKDFVFLEDRVVNRSGIEVTDELPGQVIAMSAEYVVLYDEVTAEFAVHRRTG